VHIHCESKKFHFCFYDTFANIGKERDSRSGRVIDHNVRGPGFESR